MNSNWPGQVRAYFKKPYLFGASKIVKQMKREQLLKKLRFGTAVFYASFLLSVKSKAQVQPNEEWNGPFTSWANVKIRFGAKGNGVNDDTHALQMALDSLSNTVTKFNTGPSGYTVVYLPAGIYKISETLVLKGKIGVNIIGEDPLKTIIKWAGKDSATMFLSNGSASLKLARISWDGGNGKNIEGVGFHWKDKWKNATSQSFASVNHEVADCIFNNITVGVGGGYAWNDSEITINRCTFNNMTLAGVSINGSNVHWIIGSGTANFLNCKNGIKKISMEIIMCIIPIF